MMDEDNFNWQEYLIREFWQNREADLTKDELGKSLVKATECFNNLVKEQKLIEIAVQRMNSLPPEFEELFYLMTTYQSSTKKLIQDIETNLAIAQNQLIEMRNRTNS